MEAKPDWFCPIADSLQALQIGLPSAPRVILKVPKDLKVLKDLKALKALHLPPTETRLWV